MAGQHDRRCAGARRGARPPLPPPCAASHASTTSAQEPGAGRRALVELLVAAVAVEADRRPRQQRLRAVVGGGHRLGERASWRRTRLSRTSRLYSSVQRLSPMPAPARLTTASTPASARGSSRPAAGSHPISPAPGVERTTGGPARDRRPRSRATSAVPISPWEPVTATRTSQRVRRGGDWSPGSTPRASSRGPSVGSRRTAATEEASVTDGGIWQPPEPGAAPAPTAARRPPVASPRRSRPRRPRRRPRGRSTGKVIAAAVGAVAIVGAGVFAITRISGDGASGGAATPEAAGQALLDAIDDEDVLGSIDVLLPGERETFRDPLRISSRELQRLEVLSDDANLSDIGGIDIIVEDRVGRGHRRRTSTTSSTWRSTAAIVGRSTARRCRSATGSARTSTRTCPSSTPSPSPAEEDTFPMTAVREDGRWYLSLFYTAAESTRAETDVDIPAEGIALNGGDSPEAAMDNVLDGVAQLDLDGRHRRPQPERVRGAAALRPAVPRRRPGRARRRRGRHDRRSPTARTTSPAAATRARSPSAGLTVDVTAEGETATIELRDGCWIVTSARTRPSNSCEIADSDAVARRGRRRPAAGRGPAGVGAGDVRRLREPRAHRRGGRRPVVLQPDGDGVRAGAGGRPGAVPRGDRGPPAADHRPRRDARRA